jgi:hypothetical protein
MGCEPRDPVSRELLWQRIIEATPVDALYEIAQGMNPYTTASMPDGTSIHTFAEKLQGVTDGETVAAAILWVEDGSRVTDQVAWLKQWLRTTTPENIKKFLRFVTGAPALPHGKRIIIHRVEVPGMPGAHTCSSTLDLSSTMDRPVFDENSERCSPDNPVEFVHLMEFVIKTATDFGIL